MIKQSAGPMSKPRCLALCVLVVGGVAFAVGARTHAQSLSATISVAIDEATTGDLDLLGAFLSTAPVGSQISKAQRRILMPAVEEIAVLGNARKSSAGLLAGDDGSMTVLADGSTFDVRMCAATHACVTVKFTCPMMGNVCRPASINIYVPTGGCRTIDLTQTPPVISGECAPAGG